MKKAIINTPLGIAELEGDDNGLTSFKILNDRSEPTIDVPYELREASEQIKAYFNANLQSFDLSLNLQGTDFQKRVWQELQNIPYGETTSYLQLSRSLGDEKAIRAVASANGKNPLWIIIPCHRVIGSDGSLTGYAGGISAKKWLLDFENPPLQQSLF